MSLSNLYPTIQPSLMLDFANSGALDPRITFTRASSGTYFGPDGVLYTAQANAPRFDYNPSTLAAQGFLIEEARTNSIRNNTMQGAVAGTPGTAPTNWDVVVSGSGITVEIVGTGTEDGIAYIDIRFSGTGSGSATPQIRPETTTSIDAAAGQTWAASYYLKVAGGSTTGTGTFQQVWQERDASGVTLIAANASFSTPTTASLKTQRSILTRTLTDAGTAKLTNRIQWVFTDGVPVDITLRIGLPQLEQGAFATSVIPTTTTALTRAADVASVNTLSPWYNASQGTLYAEFYSSISPSSTNIVQASFNDTTANNRFSIQSSTSARALRNTGGAGVVSTPQTANLTVFGTNKVALAVANADAAICLNGGTVATDTVTAYAVPTVTRLQLGNQIGAAYINGHLRRVTYYPRRLSNAELVSLTS